MAPSKIITLITGANQGLGFLTARILASSTTTPYHVILTARSLAKAEGAIAALTTAHACAADRFSAVELDVTSEASVAAAFEAVEKTQDRVDVLINNAAVVPKNASQRVLFTQAMATNVVGAVAVTEAFLPLLRRSEDARLLYLSSGLGSITLAADPDNPMFRVEAMAYRASKAAVDMVVVEQTKALAKEGIKLWAIDPGWRATGLAGDPAVAKSMGALDPEGGAQVIVDVVGGKMDANTGKLVWEGGVWPW